MLGEKELLYKWRPGKPSSFLPHCLHVSEYPEHFLPLRSLSGLSVELTGRLSTVHSAGALVVRREDPLVLGPLHFHRNFKISLSISAPQKQKDGIEFKEPIKSWFWNSFFLGQFSYCLLHLQHIFW